MTAFIIIKFPLVVFVAAAALSQAACYSRAGTQPRVRPRAGATATAFRPGVALHPRPLNRLVPFASRRAPYFLYKTPPHHRYTVKQFGPTTVRDVFSSGPWQSSAPAPRLAALGLSPASAPASAPAPAPVYDFMRTAPASASVSAPLVVQYDAGAIHTIPAPNLSLSEKPIVVVDSSDPRPRTDAAAEPKPSYEVTERYVEPAYQMAKIETPVGFSKMQSIESPPELQAYSYLRNGAGAALQLASDYGLSAISEPRRPDLAAPRGPALPHPQHFTMQDFQGFTGVPTQQDLLSTGAESVMIPPNVLYQSDPLFLQKLQQQLLQRFPALEFVPYAAELVTQNEAPQAQQLFLLENEEIKQPQEQFLSSESKNVVQRETPESSIVTLLPQAFVIHNVTEKIEHTTTELPRNITLEPIASDSQPITTTVEYVTESNTEPQPLTALITEPKNTQNTTPIYYAQVGQSVGNVIANGFYSAMNDVRAAAAMEQMLENIPQTTKAPQNVTTVNPISADLKQYFIQNEISENKTVTELKPLLGVPFAKPAESVKVAYTLLRTEEKEPKTIREGAVYAGQIVEASISEDHDFNNQKATLMKRAPIRLYVADKETTSHGLLASSAPKLALVKAKIPAKSKLMFDDKTGEPVLRIYASYVDSPTQRQVVTSKLATLASLKPVTRKASTDIADSWKDTTIKSADKKQGFDGNQVAKFGLKLRSRSDDYIPLFEEYDE